MPVTEYAESIFQSTLLMRGATSVHSTTTNVKEFQSTLLMRGATDLLDVYLLLDEISIHAPHARSDSDIANLMAIRFISIHAPHARSDDKI